MSNLCGAWNWTQDFMHVWQTLCQLIYTLIFSHPMPNHPYILNSAPHVFPFFSHIIYLLAGSFPSAQKQVDTSPIFKMIMIPNPPRMPHLTTHPFLLLRANLHVLPPLLQFLLHLSTESFFWCHQWSSSCHIPESLNFGTVDIWGPWKTFAKASCPMSCEVLFKSLTGCHCHCLNGDN